MPPKRGKRGRPKKVKEVEGVEVAEASFETEESGDDSFAESTTSNSFETVVEEIQTVIETVINKKGSIESNIEEIEEMNLVPSNNIPADLDSMENMETIESIETIDNMESMENDEGLNFKGLGVDDDVKPENIEDELHEVADRDSNSSKEGSINDGSAQYDPLLEEMVSSPHERSNKNVDYMETESTDVHKHVIKKGDAASSETNVDGNVSLEHETETVSEDELPSETTKPPSDTEAVSDEELPLNNAPDLLFDTEAVSEDELPPVKKRKAADIVNDQEKKGDVDSLPKVNTKEHTSGKGDPSLDTEAVSEDELPPLRKKKKPSESEREIKSDVIEEDSLPKTSLKKSSSAVNESSEGTPTKKSPSETKSNKSLLELDKYWKAVKEDPADFTGWTYLLQYVDQGQDVEAAREAYDAFLSHYPYCYGYWRKYADYEKKKGEKTKSQEVFERGLAAIPLSVDLWLHYINHIKNCHKEDESYVRQQYDRAIDVCGIEFRSDRLWDSYIKWESECKNIGNVFNIYDKLLTVPTQGYKGHFENFVDFVKTNQPNKMLSVDEFLSIRSEVLQKLKQKGSSDTTLVANAPPGDESDEETEKSPNFADEETKLMRDKIIALRTKSFKTMSNSVLDRWNYEEGIKRPYFHVKPLERCQLNNWRSYLDYEIEQGDRSRTTVLFERCLIACALYDEFWMKYVKYLESLTGDDIIDKVRNVYERACTIHHPKKPMLALNWASFEENHGNIERARQILVQLENEVPHSLQISICRINLERRTQEYDEVSKLYEHYISTNKNKFTTNALSIKYARFCQKILGDVDKGSEVLRKAIEKDKDNPRLYHQLLDLIFSRSPREPNHEEECVGIINQFLERESTDIEHKLLFAQHKVEFLEDFGSNMSSVQKAVSDYMNLLKQVKEKRRKQFEEKMKPDDKKTSGGSGKGESTAVHPNISTSNGSSGSSGYQGSNPYPNQQPPYQNNSSQYQQPSNYGQPPYNQYNNQSDPNYNNYQNWNYQQTPTYNNYNQGWGGYNYY